MVRDAAIQTRDARLKLKLGKRHWRSVHEGLAIGYRRGKRGSGSWWMRTILPRKAWESGKPAYAFRVIGIADDHAAANGADILDFKQAQEEARKQAEATKLADGRVTAALTVSKAIERYLESLKASKGEVASKDADLRLKKHVEPKWGDTLVADLTLGELQDWRNDLVNRKKDAVAKSTANRILANFKAALNGTFQDKRSGIVSDHAWRGLKGFKQADRAREDHFEAADVQKLIDEAAKLDQAFANILAAGFLTGARYGELTACDVRHFDANKGVLMIPSGKTGARAVTLLPDATEFFKAIAENRDRSAPLLPTATGERWGKSEQHRRIKKALKAAKLPETASFYSLRHSYISRSIELDVPLYIVAKNCGTSESMVRRHYAKLLATKERTMLERAAGAFKLTLIPGGKAQVA